MQISNNIKSLTALRQPRLLTGGQDNQKLVFIYPLLVSSSLSKYTPLLRDFLAVDFVSQIKISNGLNITSSISKIGRIGSDKNAINPALEVRKALNISQLQPTSNNMNINLGYNPSEYELYKKQEKINKFTEFFKKQLLINPRYSQYSSVVSTIVADENLLVFPLIVGTKIFPIETKFLFYILAAAIILDLPLNSLGNLNSILTYIQNVDPDKFNTILKLDSNNKELFKSTTTISGLLRQNPNYSDKTSNLFKLEGNELRKFAANFKKVLDFNIWRVETDYLMSDFNDLNSSTGPIIQTITQKKHFDAAMNSYNSFIGEIIVPILYGMELILGPTQTNINYQNAIQSYLDSITKNINRIYIETSEHVRVKLSELPPQTDENGNPIYQLNTNISEKFNNTQTKLNRLKSFCEDNSETVQFIKNIIYSELVPGLKKLDMTNPDTISDFCDAIVQTSSKFKPISNTIESWLLSSIPDGESNLQHKLNEVKDLFLNKTKSFFEDGDDFAIYNPKTDLNVFHLKYQNFAKVFCNCDLNNVDIQLNKECSKVLNQIMVTIIQSISDILYFLYIWNFMSYICSYINEIDVDIQIQKKDCLDFPNYTLVLPITIFKFLYVFYTSNRIKTLMKNSNPANSKELAASGIQGLQTYLPNSSVPKIIEILNDRLKIPNIMVIDERSEDVFYQFMYMKNPTKTKLNNLETYIHQQKDILTSD